MQEIETLYPEDNKPKKKNNNKDFILLIIVILIITVVCTIGLLKINDKKEKEPKVDEKENFSSTKEPKKIDEIEEELQTKNYVYRKYSCEKSDEASVLDNGIKVRKKHRYEFIFNEGVDDTPNLGYYYVDYIFNNLNDYGYTTTLPIPFENSVYEDQENINTLTKTQLFYYILEYPNIANGDLSAYLKSLENDGFVCTLVEKEEIINNYDVYYGRDTED